MEYSYQEILIVKLHCLITCNKITISDKLLSTEGNITYSKVPYRTNLINTKISLDINNKGPGADKRQFCFITATET